jgi:hypothetical protein
MIHQPTPAQRDAVARRYSAAQDLERARQICRENSRYGYATWRDRDNVHDADVAYDQATEQIRVVKAW